MKNTVVKNIMALVDEVEANWFAERKGLSVADKQDLSDAHLLNFMRTFEKEFNNVPKKDYQKTLKSVFDSLAVRWEEKAMFSSSITNVTNSPSYLAIIAIGNDVIPFVLERMQENQQHWFKLLNELTGQNPVKSEDIGNMEKMTQAWVDWGYTNKIIQEPTKASKKINQLRLF